MKVVLVGASDGIGLAMARAYLSRGDEVAILGPRPDRVSRVTEELRSDFPGASLTSAVLDVTARPRIPSVLSQVVETLGGLDLFAYCAGVLGPDPEEVFGVNVLGAIQCLEWAAEKGFSGSGGHLAAIGSVAGERGRSGNSVYGASKAALHAYLEGLRQRLHPQGIRVSTVKPGFVRTKMLPSPPSFPPPVSPEAAARTIQQKLDRGREVFFVPSWWRLLAMGVRLMPRFLFKRVGPT